MSATALNLSVSPRPLEALLGPFTLRGNKPLGLYQIDQSQILTLPGFRYRFVSFTLKNAAVIELELRGADGRALAWAIRVEAEFELAL